MRINLNIMRSRPKYNRFGFILLITMIVLVVLATLTTGLSVTLSIAKRRQQYMIEYQRARYGLDSAMKYILNEFPKKNFRLAPRQNKPDFSDLFLMNEVEYAEFVTSWAETATDEELDEVLKKTASMNKPEPLSSDRMMELIASLFGDREDSDANAVSDDLFDTDEQYYVVEFDPNDVVVPGPYGPPWPYAEEPIELEIGPCRVKISIEDENAKMPLSWLVTSSEKANEHAQDALKTFCEWMSWDPAQLRELEAEIQASMDEIYAEKAFKLNPSPVLLKKTTTRTVRSPATSRRSRTRRRTTSRTVRRVTTQKRPAIAHTTDFAKLFHSSLLDREYLARPLPDTGDRVESPLKYLSLWGAQHVNINTAPRHVLLTAFELAADSFEFPELIQQIIERRQEKPFRKLDEIKTLGGLDTETMKNLGNYLTTTSTFFKVRVDSRSGNARTSAVATVVKEGKKTQVLAILYEP